MTAHLAFRVEDGLCTASPAVRVEDLVTRARDLGLHVGALATGHQTLAQALAASDPWLRHRLVRAELLTASGSVRTPVAPRAALGPDLNGMAFGRGPPVRELTLRADRAVAWGAREDLPLGQAIALAQALAERGCTLVELRARPARAPTASLEAALPRPALTTLLAPATAHDLPPTPGAPVAAWRLGWTDAEGAWRDLAGLCPRGGAVQLNALDAATVLLRLAVPPATVARARDALKRLGPRWLGAATPVHPQVRLALSLRFHGPRPAPP
jgi:hypothetical protein